MKKTIILLIALAGSLCLCAQNADIGSDGGDVKTTGNVKNGTPNIINYAKAPKGIHPIIDGNCTYYLEWDSADYKINKAVGKRGAICREYQEDWRAMSLKDGNKIVYNGITLFEIHDFWDADSYECDDFNKFGWTSDPTPKNPNFSLIVWIFDMNCNDPDDKWLRNRTSEMLPGTGLWASHLCNRSGTDNIDDRGFIVRLNRDPNTDVQWFPGDPEPGDFSWKWPDYHGFYGRFDFNQSSRQNNVFWASSYNSVMNKPSTPNEVYEFCLHGGIGGKGGDDSTTYKPCIHTYRVLDHYDPHNGQSYYVDIIVIDGPGHVKKPWPPKPGGGGGGKNPGGKHEFGFPGWTLLVPGQLVNSYFDISNIGISGGNFITTIQNNSLLEGDIVVQESFEPLERKPLRYSFSVPPDILAGTVHRFNFEVKSEDYPDQTDAFYVDHIVTTPSTNLIWAPPGINMESPMAIMNGLSSMGHLVELHPILPDPTILSNYDVIWVCLGTAPYYHELLPGQPEYLALTHYLSIGGSVYLEGGSFWNTAPNPLKDIFNIHSESTFSTNVDKVIGYQPFKLMDFSRNVDMPVSATDKLRIATNKYTEAPGYYGNFLMFNAEEEDYSFMIYSDNELSGARTVGSSIELGSLVDFDLSGYSKQDLINRLLYLLLPPQVDPVLNVMMVIGNNVIPAGETVSFSGYCDTYANQWNWYFEGADPNYSALKSPEEIQYNMPGVYDVKLAASNTFAKGEVLAENAITVLAIIPPGWNTQPSGVNATVLIPLETKPSVNAQVLRPGDMVGAFYTDINLEKKCAGYGIWNGEQELSFSIAGDQLGTFFKEGFNQGEEIAFKIYSMAEKREYPAEGLTFDFSPAVFLQGAQINLALLKAVFEQQYFLNEGWQGISSYLLPKQESIPEIFQPIAGEVIFFGNNDHFWWPAQGINTFENWDNYSGYKLKLESSASFTVQGYIDMSPNVILENGWSLLPVFSDQAVAVEDLFDGISSLEVVISVAGTGVYWPRYEINQLYNLLPGKSYWILLHEPATIKFGDTETKQSASGNLPVEASIPNNLPWNEIHPTPNQHVIGISETALSKLTSGSIIGAFAPSGLCAGALEILNDEAASLVIFGDDPLTEQVDGFKADEQIIFRLYKPSSGEIFDLEVQFEQEFDHSGQFSAFGLSLIRDVKLTSAGIYDSENPMIAIFPNPSKGTFTISGLNGKAVIRIYSVYGTEVFYQIVTLPSDISLPHQAKGIYFISIETNKAVFFEKLIVK